MAHEQAQNEAISNLRAQVSLLSEKAAGSDEGSKFAKSVTEEGFDYLAIGNSITTHPIVDYWWGEWGMAASDADHDYYHRVLTKLGDKYETVNSTPYLYGSWELMGHDRAETFELVDTYLCEGIDLITIQLSENASDLSTFESDYVELINHIREKCGSEVQIILIDDFWDDKKSEIKRSVAETTGIDFVDLTDIRGVVKYQSYIGAIVQGDDGEVHTVEHSGVAIHPGDEGMAVIADRVLEIVQ